MKGAIVNFVESKRLGKEKSISVGFVGFGKTNAAIYEILKDCPSCDFTLRQERAPSSATPDGFKIITGDKALAGICEDILFLSPSVRRERLECSSKTVLISDTDIFFTEKRNTFAVTGSDGKSTVTTLTAELLKQSFPTLFIGGNLGTPVALARLDGTSAFVLELSSFNLNYTVPHSRRAIVTNITPNHLNWHSSYGEYVEAKRRALIFTDEPIINADTDMAEKIALSIPLFAVCSTRFDASTLKVRHRAEHILTLEDGKIMLDGEPILQLSELYRNEKHNIANMMSAIAMSIGCADKDEIRRVAREFKGLEHRCECFLESDGISFINSSIDTSPERTKATLSSLNRRVTLILGGRGKGLDLSPLKQPIKEYTERIAIYGEMSEELIRFIESDNRLCHVPHAAFSHFDDALDYAIRFLKPGDTLLLSPSATAYGEFPSFAERGTHFKEYILKKYNKTKN